MDMAADTRIWDYALENGFVIAIADDAPLATVNVPDLSDFGRFQRQKWHALLRNRHDDLVAFYQDDGTALLELF